MAQVKSNIGKQVASWQNLQKGKGLPTVEYRVQGQLQFPTALARRAFRTVLDIDFLTQVVDRFMAEMLLPLIHKEWLAKSTIDYTPQLVKGLKRPKGRSSGGDAMNVAVNMNALAGSKLRKEVDLFEEKGTMLEGFEKLWKKIEIRQIVKESRDVGWVGFGNINDVTSLRLSRFMPNAGGSGTQSQFNTLFYAVEFGTGAFVKSPWTRTEGETKMETPKGAWWFPAVPSAENNYFGIPVKGQKAFNVFYEPTTRIPRARWQNYIRAYLPRYVRDSIAKRAPTVTF